MAILITGGAGYIGSHTMVEFLNAGRELVVVDNIATAEYKTKNIVNMLAALGADKKALIVTAEADEKVYKSARNIKGVTPTYVGVLNTYEILKHDKFIVAKDAIAKIEEVLC